MSDHEMVFIHHKHKHYEAALESYKKSIQLAQYVSYERIGFVLHKMADLFRSQQKYAQALEKFEASYDTFEKVENYLEMGRVLKDAGLTYCELRDFANALAIFEQALATFHKARRSDSEQIVEFTRNQIELVKKHL